jgi:hypothetical protein
MIIGGVNYIIQPFFFYKVRDEAVFEKPVRNKKAIGKETERRQLLFKINIRGVEAPGISEDKFSVKDAQAYVPGETYTIWKHIYHPDIFRINRFKGVGMAILMIPIGVVCLALTVLAFGR